MAPTSPTALTPSDKAPEAGEVVAGIALPDAEAEEARADEADAALELDARADEEAAETAPELAEETEEATTVCEAETGTVVVIPSALIAKPVTEDAPMLYEDAEAASEGAE